MPICNSCHRLVFETKWGLCWDCYAEVEAKEEY